MTYLEEEQCCSHGLQQEQVPKNKQNISPDNRSIASVHLNQKGRAPCLQPVVFK